MRYSWCLLIGWWLASCSSSEQHPELLSAQPAVPLDSILKDRHHTEQYLSAVLLPDLGEGQYLAYDTSGYQLSTEKFLKDIQSGHYLPLKMKTEQDTVSVYQLQPLTAAATEPTAQFLAFISRQHLLYSQLKGNPLPDFQFTDLDGRTYRAEDLQDKLVVVKFWYIGCRPCVEEMPVLNDLVAQYQNQDDVIFLSLANDGEEPLRKFLTRFPFDYAVIPDQEAYTMDTLGVNTFPTHMILEGGVVREITNNANSLIELLNARSAAG